MGSSGRRVEGRPGSVAAVAGAGDYHAAGHAASYDGIDGLRRLPPGTVVSVGNYDGVHRGHAALLARARRWPGRPGWPWSRSSRTR